MDGVLGLLLFAVAAVVMYYAVRPPESDDAPALRPEPLAPPVPAIDTHGNDSTAHPEPAGPAEPAAPAGPAAGASVPGAGTTTGSGRAHTPARRSRTGDILGYGTTGGDGYRHSGGYAAIGLLTTGYAPMKDAIVEIAVIRLDPAGRPIETYRTLVRPQPGDPVCDTLGTIAADDLFDAPTYADLAPTLLELLAGSVVVTLRTGGAGAFLGARFLQAGMVPDRLPALALDRFAPTLLGTPNLRPATLARRLAAPYPLPPTAVDRAALVAACVPPLLDRFGDALRYPCPLYDADAGPSVITVTGARPSTPRRAPSTPIPPVPFLSDLLAAAPHSVHEMNDPRVAAYLEDVTALLAQGRIVKDEIIDLSQRLARAGTSTERIRAIASRLLESLREASFGHPSLSPTQLRHLRATATSLSVPGYFDDLIPPPPEPVPEPGSGSFARPVRKPPPAAPPARLPRCGNCLRVGHYTAVCPMPAAGRVASIGRVEPPGRVGPIRPIGPA